MQRWATFIISLGASTALTAQTPYPHAPGLIQKQFDDGAGEQAWRLTLPSSANNWQSVDFDGRLGGCEVVTVGADFTTFSLLGNPTFGRLGIYGDNLTVDPSGATPDVSGAQTFVEVTGGSTFAFPAPLCNFLSFRNNAFTFPPGVNAHVAIQEAAGDTALWLCADSSSPSTGRSFFTTNGFATPATPFTQNWCLRVGTVPPNAGNGTLLVNGATATSVFAGLPITVSFFGSTSNVATFLFWDVLGPLHPISAVLFTGNGSGPNQRAWSATVTSSCTVPIGFPIQLRAFYLNPTAGSRIEVSNTVRITFVGRAAICAQTCFGQKDDGAFDGFTFRVSNPSGSRDWFNVRHGNPPSAVSTLTGVEIATWDFCGTGGTGSWSEVGIYPTDLALSPAGNTPDLTNPIATIGGASAPIPPMTGDWGYPAQFFDTPDVPANATTSYHGAVQWNSGDSCLWVAADTTATGPSFCGAIPNTTSFSSADGYTSTTAGTSTSWMIKIDWQ